MAIELAGDYSPEDVADFQSLKGKRGLEERGIYIAESPKIVEKVLRGEHVIDSAFLTEAYFQKFRSLLEARRERVRVMVAPKTEMEKIVGYPLHQGVMLSVRIPANVSIADVAEGETGVIVALDGIADAENMGAIVRNCAAFGVRALLVDEQSCSPYLRRAVRVSMGCVVDVRICRVPDLVAALSELRGAGKHIAGAALSDAAIDLGSFRHAGTSVLAFGSEGWGLRPEVRNACDALLRIPMAAGIDSLNVAIASGIFLHHFACLERP